MKTTAEAELHVTKNDMDIKMNGLTFQKILIVVCKYLNQCLLSCFVL
jgi:hypothetical protein